MRKASSVSGVLVVASLLAAGALICPPQSENNLRAEAPKVPFNGVDRQKQKGSNLYSNLPPTFEINRGQTDKRVKYLSRGRGHNLYLRQTEAVLQLLVAKTSDGRNADLAPQPLIVRMEMVGANPEAQIVGRDELPGKSSYFIGNDRRKWRTDIANYASVRYSEIYPGIDMVYYYDQGRLEYDFVVSPGADYKDVSLKYHGAESVKLNEQGELVIANQDAQIKQTRPLVYQAVDGVRKTISGSYMIKGENEVGFQVAEYDANRPLIIDPAFVYSTYLGGTGSDSGESIAIDGAGNTYITGLTLSTDFPLENPFQPAIASPGRSDVFVAKLNAAGTALIYSTYVGGSVGDIGTGIDIDSAGNAYVTGTTGGSISFNDFPTVNAQDSTYGGTDDAFLFKLNPDGNSLIFSTYHGGGGSDTGTEVAVDRASGAAYVVGYSNSDSFPTTPGAFKPAPCGPGDLNGFVTKYDAAGSIVYSTLFGGCVNDTISDLAIDTAGNAYLVGSTNSGNFPVTPGAFNTGCNGCQFFRSDVFVSKLNPTGTNVVYSSRFGGSLSDGGLGIAVDGTGNAYATGRTISSDFPVTPGVFQPVKQSNNAFVTKLSADGSTPVYSSFLGGNIEDVGRSIAVDEAGRAYVTGSTRSTNFPTVDALQTNLGGPGANDAFVTVVNPSGSALIFSTYLGGLSRDDGYHIVTDGAGNAFVTGQTFAADFPVTPGAFQTTFGSGGSTASGGDAFVSRIRIGDSCASLSPASESFSALGSQGEITVSAACDWTATTDADWITLVAINSVEGTVTYQVSENLSASRREGTIIIGGETFTAMQGARFNDVQEQHPFYIEIGKLSARGVTAGCGGGNYCPDEVVTREQMAAFIMRARGELSPATPPSQRFQDVPPSNIFYNFIDRLAVLQITLGCSQNPPLYCPGQPVLREQMAAFLIRGLGEFNPPEPPMQRFLDVPPSNPFYRFIDRMAVLQITFGCGGGNYCPTQSVTRAQMAAFLVRAFNL